MLPGNPPVQRNLRWGIVMEVPSGKRLQFAMENGHRNSGFSHEKE